MKTENTPFTHPLINFELPPEVERVLSQAPSVAVPETLADLRSLALCDADDVLFWRSLFGHAP